MATSLYRMCREAYRRRWYLAVVWVGALEVAGFGARKVPAARFDAGLPPDTQRWDHEVLMRPSGPAPEPLTPTGYDQRPRS